MHIYPTKTLQRKNNFHASLDRNLPKLFRKQIKTLTDKVKEEGFILNRVPSIDLEPIDKERELLKQKDKVDVFQQVSGYLDNRL